MMDNTIKRLLETDANAENIRQAAIAESEQILENARQQAAAQSEARTHHTKDLIFEIEESERTAYEEKYRALMADYEKQTATLSQRFDAQHEELLMHLMQQVLAGAEQTHGN